jgi:uncharacterized membrane protein
VAVDSQGAAGTGRLETFSDGVFAIAITLLILEIVPPHDPGRLAHELLQLWPSYLAYAVSFLTIGIMWVNHHDVFRLVGRTDRLFLFLNTVLLLCIAFVPFPTAVLGDFIRSGEGRGTAAVFFAGTFTVTAIVYNVFWRYAASGRRLIAPAAADADVQAVTRSYLVGPVVYAIATAVGFASAWASVAICALLSLSYALPASRWLTRRS